MMEWRQLESIEDISKLNKSSDSKHIIIFKHSTSCGISRFVLKNFEKDIDSADFDQFEFYMLDLLKYRAVSNHISEFYDITHESPQLLHIRKGTVISHSSHSNISAGSLLA